jgi:Rad3-related DNA helicase
MLNDGLDFPESADSDTPLEELLDPFDIPDIDNDGDDEDTKDWFPSAEAVAAWRDHFPMPEFRKHQEATIEGILRGWASGKKYAIVEGCTGSGKSTYAITLGSLFQNTFLATPQKMLQTQYMGDFPKILFELKGRVNYPCLRLNRMLWQEPSYAGASKVLNGKLVEAKQDKRGKFFIAREPIRGTDFITLTDWKLLPEDHPQRSLNCVNAPCNTMSGKAGSFLKGECRENGVCEYMRRRDYAMNASSFTLMNFSNLLLFSLLMPKPYEQRPLLILDECHALESYLYEFATITIGYRQLKPLTLFVKTPDALDRIREPFTIEELVDYIKITLIPALKKYKQAASLREKKADDPITNDFEYEEDVTFESRNEEDRIKDLTAKLNVFLKSNPTTHSHVLIPYEVDKKGDANLAGRKECVGVKIKPFSVAHLGPSLAFHSSNSRVLLMSATILDPKTFCKSVGIPVEQAFFVRVPSTFPPENRLMIGDLSVGSMTYYNKDKTLPKMLDRILELSQKHGEHKGLIHTGNYENMRKLKKWVKNTDAILAERILFPEEKGSYAQKEKLISFHSTTDEPTILCGPGFIEGLNLKDDLARFNILMKVPYMSLGDPLIKRKAEEFPEWYALQVALAIIQAVGRTVRSEIDWSLIYILDLMWRTFYSENKNKLFPPYIQESIRWISTKYPEPFKLEFK